MTDSEAKRPGEKKGKLLWTPSRERVASSRLFRFMRSLENETGRRFAAYDELHAWSVTEIDAFWRAVARDAGLVRRENAGPALASAGMPGARWFPDVRLNFADSLLRADHGPTAGTAIAFESEDEALARDVGWSELRRDVARCARALRAAGVKPGDRVAALTPNVPEAVVAMLGATAIGAIWSSCSPDFGVQGVLDRFGQIEPKVLFAADGYVYGGKRFGLEERLRAVLERIPSIESVVVYEYAGPPVAGLRGQIAWEGFLGTGDVDLQPVSLPFDHPVYILYTSGTTGVPKCIVHGAGGTLLKHYEEHALQCDFNQRDVAFYFTTCGWMMWNWLVSALATAATIVLYDGNPLWPDAGRLFRAVDRRGISVFGTSPRFLAAVEKSGHAPRSEHSLASLRTILSTGSPLHAPQFEWVYRDLKSDVQLASISGGTDLIGCFVLGSPLHPVYAGEIQCKALGMKVESVDESGRPVVGAKGELVCSAPFPSMPVGFWNDTDGEKYSRAYFDRFPGRWHHGDFIEITERGTIIIHGRSDATLNPGGVRIGTAEIYRIVERIPGINDALAVGVEEDDDVRIWLFVVLDAETSLDDTLRATIRKAIRESASPRHVPAEIHAISAVPRTISGKSVELAVAAVLRGEEALNRDALANPEALDQFQAFVRER